MAKIRFTLSLKELSIEFEGDQETGKAVSESVQNTLNSLSQAQNAVIDITPDESSKAPAAALPHAPSHIVNSKQIADRMAHSDGALSESTQETKSVKPRKSRGQGFRTLAYQLLSEDYFAEPRTSEQMQAELAKRGFHIPSKNVSSDLTQLTKKGYLSREKNSDGVYAYTPGRNNDYPRY